MGKELPAGHGKVGYEFFTRNDQRPEVAVSRLGAPWLVLTFYPAGLTGMGTSALMNQADQAETSPRWRSCKTCKRWRPD